MLVALSILALLFQLPFFALMIIAPRRELTRRLTAGYWPFVVLGALFIFLFIGLLAQLIGLGNTVNGALGALPADLNTLTADGGKPLADALRIVSSALPTITWIGVALAGLMDLASAYLIYRETQHLGTRPATAGALIALAYVFGPLGMLIFALWHSLTVLRATHPATVAPVGKESPAS